jgi:hypothetical protein
MDVEQAYWFTDFARLTEKIEEMAKRSKRPAKIFSVGKTFSGRDIPAIRIGEGKEFNPMIVAGHHGAEVLGTYGCLAIIDTLLNDASPTGEDLSGWAEKILNRCTITIVPLVNVDCAVRFQSQVPSCDYNVGYSRDPSDWDRYVKEYNEPRSYLAEQGDPPPPHHFTEEQVRRWTALGKPLGCRYSDQGIDLWSDYLPFRAPETRAMRDFVLAENPCAVLEIHNQEPPSRVYAPIWGCNAEDSRAQLNYGEEMMTRLAERGLPGSKHSVHTYNFSSTEGYRRFIDFIYDELGCLIVFVEISHGYLNDHYREMLRKEPLLRRDADAPVPPRSKRILTGWSWIQTFLDMGTEREFK